jgi:hypothetical protein
VTQAPAEGTARSVVIDRAIRRGCVRAQRPNPWLVLLVAVAAAAAIFALLPLGGLTWPTRTLVGAVVGALAAPATLWLQGRDAGRALPLGERLTTQWSADGIRHGIEGREEEHPWSQLAMPRVRRGHLVLATRSASGHPFCLPPALLLDGDAEWITDMVRASFLAQHGGRTPEAAPATTPARPLPSAPATTPTETGSTRPPFVVDSVLAHQMATDAAAAVTRTGSHLLVALLVFAAGVSVVVGGDLPHPWISVAFVVVVAIRWIGPVLARRRALAHIRPPGEGDYAVSVTAAPDGCVVAVDGRETPATWSAFHRVRTRGSAVILEGGAGRVILPVAAFPAGLVAEAEKAIRADRP